MNMCKKHSYGAVRKSHHGASYCELCNHERRMSKEWHDIKIRSDYTCTIHGPHFIQETNLTGIREEWCTECASPKYLINRCESPDCKQCAHCKVCDREEKELEKKRKLEELTAPSLPDLSEKLLEEARHKMT